MEENKNKKLQKKNNLALIKFLIVFFVLIFVVLGNCISLRGEYLSIKEINSNYLDIFFKNLKIEYSIFGINFIIVFILFFITNLIIKKGLKPFFEDEKKDIPKLPNKSISFIIAIITSFVAKYLFFQKYMLFSNVAWFGMNDPVFNKDIGHYMFILPFLKILIYYIIGIMVLNFIYIALYNLLTFNIYLNGIDRELFKKSKLIKQLIFDAIIIVILFSGYIWVNSENILTGTLMNIKNAEKTELVGAGSSEITIKVIGYRIFAIIIVLVALKLVSCIKKAQFKQGFFAVCVIPVYLIGVFLVMLYTDTFLLGSNAFDKQKKFIGYNIENTKDAYGIDFNQVDLNNYETITNKQVEENNEFLNKIPLFTSNIIEQSLDQNQEDSMYYSYKNSKLGLFEIDGETKLVYTTPRELITENRTYNNLTYEYTHGYSAVLSSASEMDKNGNPLVFNPDDRDIITEPRIYFGTEDYSDIIVNSNYGKEYDYLISATQKKENTYSGQAGLKLNFIDRLVLGIRNGNLKLAFSSYLNEDSKVLINRNVIDRVKLLMPNLIYDDPYLVITDSGKLLWVIDGYTYSKEYPYSQIVNCDGNKINYIRNSVKVLVDCYNGTTDFYVMDNTDPIIQAYKNMYPTLFEKSKEDISADISNQFTYPMKLFEVQSQLINLYHGTSEDVLYRGDNVWQVSTENTSKNSKISPYYSLVNTLDSNKEELGLMITYNKYGKQSMTSYMIGTVENGKNILTLYKFDTNTSIAGISQVNNQIDQDEVISKELEKLNTPGTKLIRDMEVVPLENTLLYVERVFQVMLNDAESIPELKKIIVASGNKLAMGDNLEEAISNLYGDYSIELNFYDADDIDALIDSIIKSNKNLKESFDSNDYEMIGKDFESLEKLIDQLEVLQKKNKKENKKNEIDAENDGNEEESIVEKIESKFTNSNK